MTVTFGPTNTTSKLIKTRVLNDDFLFYDQKSNYHQLRLERDDMPGAPHNNLVDYLLSVLRWYYRAATYTTHREVNLYNLADKSAGMVDKQGRPLPVYPDIVMFKSEERYIFTSYRIDPDNQPPELIIEIISDNTPTSDLVDKPIIYERWGIKEYFTYDPRPRIRKTAKPRLSGWRLNASTGRYEVLTPDIKERLWSEQLEVWLVSDGENLRLVDTEGRTLLSEKEGEQEGRKAAEREAKIERQARRRQFKQAQEALRRELAATQREEAERQAKEEVLQREMEALQQLEAERQARQDAQQEIERLREELRRLQSPDNGPS